jgi:hypothetical protein
MSSANTNTSVIIEYPEWDTTKVKYMPPKLNDKGGKMITVISTQSNRALAISTAPMTTWGISDFCNEDGESDGKFKLSLQFPNEQYKTPETDAFLEKMKAFENQVIDDAVKNSELWWGKKKSRELVEDSFFPYFKYPKDEKKSIDYSKPPSMKPKVPCYGGEWKTRIFDVDYKKVFPNESLADATPMDYVPKGSQVICGLKTTGVWIGGKGWGLTWQVEQLIVKPRVVQRVDNDVCHIRLSDKDRNTFAKSRATTSVDEYEEMPVPTKLARHYSCAVSAPYTTDVPDSDDEMEPITAAPAPGKVDDKIPETSEELGVHVTDTLVTPTDDANALADDAKVEETSSPVVPSVKKVIKKAAPVVQEEVVAPVVAPVKKIVKKKVV